MKTTFLWMSVCLLAGLMSLLVGCGDDEDSGLDGGTDSSTDGDTDTDSDCDTDIDAGFNCDGGVPVTYDQVCSHEIGDCLVMEDCASGYCEIYSVAPWDTDAECMDPPPADTINIVGSVRDFESNEALPGVTVSVADGATVLLAPDAAYESMYRIQVVSDSNGKFNQPHEWIISPMDMGLVSLIKEDGYFFTGTGFVEPTAARITPTGLLNHNAMVISESLVTTLKALIAEDANASKYTSNIFGKVLYADLLDGTGNALPVQGATIKNTTGSNMKIYYVNKDMDGLTASATASHGMFIVADPALKDKLRAYRCNTPIDYYESTLEAVPQELVYAIMVPVYSTDDPKAPR
jgi:hypothetical protein